MAKEIWKFPLKIMNAEQSIAMPSGSKTLCVQVQAGVPVVWIEVDTEMNNGLKTFKFIPTGGEVPHNAHWVYRDTVQLHGGSFVLHIYEQL